MLRCVRVAILSWTLEAYINETAATNTLYYSGAQHYSWPNSLSMLLGELLDSFPFLWSCMVCGFLCACQSLFMWEWGFFFPLKGKWLILGMCDKSHLYPLFSSEPSFDWSGWGQTLSHITKYDTLKNIDTNTCTHTHTLVWKDTSLFL